MYFSRLIFIIYISIQYPATHGVLRITAILHSKIIQWINPKIRLLHRETDKLIEYNYYNSNIGYFDNGSIYK